MTKTADPQSMHQALTGMDWVFVAAGLLFLTIGASWIGYQVYWEQGTTSTEGQVIRMEFGNGGNHGMQPIVEYTVAGQTHTVRGITSKPPAYSVGDKAPVRYRIDNPADAVIDAFLQRWLLPVIFTGMGSLFTGIFGRSWMRGRRERGENLDLQN
jgi:hypothetical protein